MSAKFNFNTLKTGFEVDWPVAVNVPADGGTVEKQEFMARFRFLTEEQDEEVKASTDPHAWVEAFWVGMGKDEPAINPETRRLMLLRPYVREGLVAAYIAFMRGAPVKN